MNPGDLCRGIAKLRTYGSIRILSNGQAKCQTENEGFFYHDHIAILIAVGPIELHRNHTFNFIMSPTLVGWIESDLIREV